MLPEGIHLEVTNCIPKEIRSVEPQLTASKISPYKILANVPHLVSPDIFLKVTKIEQILNTRNLQPRSVNWIRLG